jgi:hypothetical protein
MACRAPLNTVIVSTHAAQGLGEDKTRNTSGIHLPETKIKAIFNIESHYNILP